MFKNFEQFNESSRQAAFLMQSFEEDLDKINKVAKKLGLEVDRTGRWAPKSNAKGTAISVNLKSTGKFKFYLHTHWKNSKSNTAARRDKKAKKIEETFNQLEDWKVDVNEFSLSYDRGKDPEDSRVLTKFIMK